MDGSAISQIAVHPDTIYSLSWNHVGSAFATTCKDRIVRVIDARSGVIIAVCIFLSTISVALPLPLSRQQKTFPTCFLAPPPHVVLEIFIIIIISQVLFIVTLSC